MTTQRLIENLKIVLADSYSLLLKTQSYHWNVTGANFYSLHKMFEVQYNDLFTAVDIVAERIRALGAKAPGSYSSFSKITNIKEGKIDNNSVVMLQDLAHDQEIIIQTLIKTQKNAQELGDEATVGIVASRIEAHQKNYWMLNSSL
jgi:starvation-inducible DNA-binding protein